MGSFNEPTNGSRACGRTESMVKHAAELLESGRHVTVVGMTYQSAKSFKSRIEERLTNRDLILNLTAVGLDNSTVDIIEATSIGKPFEVVLVDHYAWRAFCLDLRDEIRRAKQKLQEIQEIISR